MPFLVNLKSLGWMTEWGIILLAIGYYISAPVAILLNVDSRPINIIYRAIVVGLFFLPFLFSFSIKTKISKAEILLFTFWLIYLIRLIVDQEVRGIVYNNTTNTGLNKGFIYLLVPLNIIVPFIATFRLRDHINIDRLYRNITTVVVISCVLVVYSVLTSDQYLNRELYSRFALGKDASPTLNPIRISFIGFVCVFTSVYRLVFIKNSMLQIGLFVFSLIAGLFCLLIGGSRGPLLLLLFGLLFQLFLWAKKNRSAGGRLKLIAWATISIIGVTSYVSIHIEEFIVFSRITDTLDRLQEGEKEERNLLFDAAIQQFYDSPILGSQWVISSENPDIDRVMPHNIFIESLMAVGILGSVFLFGAFIHFLKKFLTSFKFSVSSSYFIILVSCVLIQSIISGAIFLDVEFWALFNVALIIK